MATLLCQAGRSVTLLERRLDPRRAGAERGRSINLAISTRGLHALAAVGLEAEIQRMATPLRGRMIHSPHGDLAFLLDRGIGGPPDPVSAARRLLLPQGLVSGEGDWSREQLKGAMPSFSEETRKAVQQEFTQLGLYSGAIDGLWSATSQYAAELYLEKYVKAEKK